MPNPTELRLAEHGGAAREASALPAGSPEPGAAPAEPTVFDDEVLLWALASSTCGGIDACRGSDPER